MRIAFADTNRGWTKDLGDIVVAQAERVFMHRKARNELISPDLLGEPAWDILLYAFVAAGKSRVCWVETLAREVRLCPDATRGWIERLAARDLVEDCGASIVITPHADAIMRRIFRAHLIDIDIEFGPKDGMIQFSSGSVSEGE